MYALTCAGCPSSATRRRVNARSGGQLRCSPCKTIVAPAANTATHGDTNKRLWWAIFEANPAAPIAASESQPKRAATGSRAVDG